jgi:hypothetical protein
MYPLPSIFLKAQRFIAWFLFSTTGVKLSFPLTLATDYVTVVTFLSSTCTPATCSEGLGASTRLHVSLPRRSSFPGTAPVGSPSSMSTEPLTTVARNPAAVCSSRFEPPGRSAVTVGRFGPT